jgi:hypothetical protein
MPSFSSSPSVWLKRPSPLDEVFVFNINDLVFMYAFFLVFITIYNSMSLSINRSRLKSIESKNDITIKLLEKILDGQAKQLPTEQTETFYFSEKGKKLHSSSESRHLRYANTVNEITFTPKQVEILRQLQCISEDHEINL